MQHNMESITSNRLDKFIIEELGDYGSCARQVGDGVFDHAHAQIARRRHD